jgi:hypothetical protein
MNRRHCHEPWKPLVTRHVGAVRTMTLILSRAMCTLRSGIAQSVQGFATGLGPTEPPAQWVLGLFPWGKSAVR